MSRVKNRIWSLLAAGLGVLYLGMPCEARLRNSLVSGSKTYLFTLLDPSNVSLLLGSSGNTP